MSKVGVEPAYETPPIACKLFFSYQLVTIIVTVFTKPIQTRNVIGLSLTSNTNGLLEQGGIA